jgi:hypothetical protein
MAEPGLAAGLAAAGSPDQLLELEGSAGHGGRFADLDRLAADLVAAALSGSKVADITRSSYGEQDGDLLTLTTVGGPGRALLDQAFALPAQQARGAWFLPEWASLQAATMNLPAYLRRHPWHAVTLAGEDVARVRLASTPDALAAWALLIPLFDTLLAPVTERAAGSTLPADEQQATWTAILEGYRRLGIPASPAVSVFAYRGGWSGLDRAGQAHARVALLDAIAGVDLPQAAARFRAQRVQALAAAVVKKSRHGTPLARQVLTKALQPVLAAYFAGDWLAFLDYLGLPPNPNEEVVTTLPRQKLYVGDSAKAASVAAEHGLALDDVHAMLAAFTGQGDAVSPVERRVDVLGRWWTQFDAVHARQATGMTPLWGLVEEGAHALGSAPGPVPGLYRQLMPTDLVDEVDRLWDGLTLPRWPETIVSEPYPHRLMAETLGPAVRFWHGVALTAWYVCEGPYSRTPLSGLRDYHDRDLAALAEAGTPVHPSLFDQLLKAEQHLGPPRDLDSQFHEVQLPEGGSIGIRISGGGQCRDGFEFLRDVITRHRGAWTTTYLADYLRHRWNHELGTVARELHRFLAAKGKAPTFRQFARFAAPAANHWFNGNLAGLYTTIGEKAPAVPRRVDLLATTANDFVNAVYAALGGERYDEPLWVTDYPAALRYHQQARLAAASLYYLQLTEALGRTPEPSEFGANRYKWDWASGLEKGWQLYQRAIEQARSVSRN